MCSYIADEVREKTKALERKQAKLLSAEEDIKDLSAEFEIDRQDYLDTIRNQEKTIKLCEQLLGVVVPCLRRDCNYFNIDKVRTECQWDENAQQWLMPKLVINKTILSPPSISKGAVRKGAKTTPTHAGSSRNSSSSSDTNIRDSSRAAHNFEGSTDDDRYMLHFHQKSDESLDYFKPKRAMELLGQNHSSTREILSPIHNHTSTGASAGATGSSEHQTTSVKSSGSNAATVHGVDPLLDSNFGSRRPGKLQSLARNPPAPVLNRQEPDILEKVEKRLTGRKNLEPLADIKTKRQH